VSSGQIQGRNSATGQPVRVCWNEGVITRVEKIASAPEDFWLAPTLFDLQVNGYGGVDFQQDLISEDDLVSVVRQLSLAGCGRFLLTLITDHWTRLTTRLRHVHQTRARSPELRRAIVGWHIEGPFLSAEPGFCGAHDPKFMRDPTHGLMDELRAITGEDPVLLTLAPERPGSIAAIAHAVSLGFKVSLGHTNASREVLQEAVRAGATGFTHLANGCPQALDRHDNILWRVLETGGLTVSLIPDRIHVSPSFFRLAHRLLPSGSVYYTTDAMAAAGAKPGRYRLGAMELEVGPDQVVRRPGQPYLAGSALSPIEGVRRAAEMLRCGWRDAWSRFSQTPARLMGLRNEFAEGGPADFCCVKLAHDGEILCAQTIGAETAPQAHCGTRG
jgi:N-acetylglucosamine-6-phosphate deacetylase